MGSDVEVERRLTEEEEEEGAEEMEMLRLWPRDEDEVDDPVDCLELPDDPPPRRDIRPSATSSSSSSLRRFSLILCVTPSIFSGESSFFCSEFVPVATPLLP